MARISNNANGVPFKRPKPPIYVFIDESGNSGSNVFDVGQPLFRNWAVMSKTDLDSSSKAKKDLSSILSKIGVEEAHSTELRPARLLKIAPDIVKMIRDYDIRFAKAEIEKSFYLGRSIMEYCLDPDNGADIDLLVNPEMGVHVGSRLYAIAENKGLLKIFWTALISKDEQESLKSYSYFCGSMAKEILASGDPTLLCAYLPMLENSWSPEKLGIFIEAVTPEGKARRAIRTPNFMAFIRLMLPVEDWCRNMKASRVVIVHDTQNEMAVALPRLAGAMSGLDLSKIIGATREISSLGIMVEKDFSFKDSKESVGIQIADVVMGLESMWIKGKKKGDVLENAISEIFNRTSEARYSWSDFSEYAPSNAYSRNYEGPRMRNARGAFG